MLMLMPVLHADCESSCLCADYHTFQSRCIAQASKSEAVGQNRRMYREGKAVTGRSVGLCRS